DASIIANGKAFDIAIKDLQSINKKTIGLHATFIDQEKPTTSFSPYLMENDHFITSREVFLKKVLMRPSYAYRIIQKEVEAQVEKVLDSGLIISHLDSHQHLHIFPILSNLFISVCEKYGIPFIRVPLCDLCSSVKYAVNTFNWKLK